MSAPAGGTPATTSPAPRVSVILPTRNRAGLLPRAVRSALDQTFAALELIVVDDASTDRTREVVADLAEADPRVRTIHLPKAVGGAAARNRGTALARGAYVAFLDDDDEWLPTMLASHLACLGSAPAGTGMSYSPYVHVAASGREEVRGAVDLSGRSARSEFFRRNFVTTSAVVLRREVVTAVGGFDEQLPRLQDWDLWVRISAVSTLVYVPEPLTYQHSTPGSITTRTDALVEACRLLAAKVAAREDVSPAERADWCYALGHALMIGGAPAEGRKLLRRSVRLQPWPPRRLAMAALASWAPGLHGAVSAAHRRVMEP